MANDSQLAVAADPRDDTALQQRAANLAQQLKLPLAQSAADEANVDALLVVTDQRLELRILRGEADFRGGRPVAAELEKLDITSNFGRSLRQPLGKALGIVRRSEAPRVLDATAGWGEDTWLMAALGCEVVAVERSALAVAMLRDALRRAGEVHGDVRARIEVVHGDALTVLHAAAQRQTCGPTQATAEPFDVVYLDPMFPGGRKTAERKAMKALRLLVGSDADAGRLLDAAIAVARRRVVVKRPLHAPPLAGRVPSVTHKGKGMRFDVYPHAQTR